MHVFFHPLGRMNHDRGGAQPTPTHVTESKACSAAGLPSVGFLGLTLVNRRAWRVYAKAIRLDVRTPGQEEARAAEGFGYGLKTPLWLVFRFWCRGVYRACALALSTRLKSGRAFWQAALTICHTPPMFNTTWPRYIYEKGGPSSFQRTFSETVLRG